MIRIERLAGSTGVVPVVPVIDNGSFEVTPALQHERCSLAYITNPDLSVLCTKPRLFEGSVADWVLFSQCRIGRAGQGFPDFAIPTVVGEAAANRVYVGDAYIGATKRHAQLTSTRLPIRRGASL